jgi:hypothetical protein
LYTGETVTEIYLISAAQSSAKVTGTVLAIDEGKRIITILVGGKLIYINYQGVVHKLRQAQAGLMQSPPSSLNPHLLPTEVIPARLTLTL